MVTPVTDRVQFPDIKVDGSAPTSTTLGNLETVRVERSLWMPSRCTIRFSDTDLSITDAGTFAVGMTLKVSLPDIAGAAAEVFDGEFTDMAVEQDANGNHQRVAGGMDKGHRLACEVKPRAFATKTYSEIVKTTATDSGLKA